MTVNELISELQKHARSRPAARFGTRVVVRCLDEELPIDCVELESDGDGDYVLAIRIEPTEYPEGHHK